MMKLQEADTGIFITKEEKDILIQRAGTAMRTAKQARDAAKIARSNGDEATASDLEHDAEELETWAKHLTIDLNDEEDEEEPNEETESEEEEGKESESEKDGKGKDSESEKEGEESESEEDGKKAAEDNKNNDDAGEESEDEKAKDGKDGDGEGKDDSKKGKSSEEESEDEGHDSKDTGDDGKDSGSDAKDDGSDSSGKGKNSGTDEKDSGSEGKSGEDTGDTGKEEGTDEGESGKETGDDSGEEEGEDTGEDDGDTGEEEGEDTGEDDGDTGEEEGEDTGEEEEETTEGSSEGSGEETEKDDGEDEGYEEPDEWDPFDEPEGGTPTSGGKEVTHEEEIEQIKRILAGLDEESARGAKDGIKKVLSDRGVKISESLTERFDGFRQSVQETSQEDYEEKINSVLDKVSKIKPITYRTDVEARVAEIKRDNEDSILKRELDAEDKRNINPEKAVKTWDKESDKYRNRAAAANMADFKLDFWRAINDQVDKVEYEDTSWGELNRQHAHDTIIAPGDVIDTRFEEHIPTIRVYYDQSGSWSDEEIKIGDAALSVVKEFEDNNEIKMDILYFSDVKPTPDKQYARNNGATECWGWILDDIEASGADNVVIVTDTDIAYDWRRPGRHGCYNTDKTVTVDGCVWFLWKWGKVVDGCAEKLRGRISTKNFALTAPKA